MFFLSIFWLRKPELWEVSPLVLSLMRAELDLMTRPTWPDVTFLHHGLMTMVFTVLHLTQAAWDRSRGPRMYFFLRFPTRQKRDFPKVGAVSSPSCQLTPVSTRWVWKNVCWTEWKTHLFRKSFSGVLGALICCVTLAKSLNQKLCLLCKLAGVTGPGMVLGRDTRSCGNHPALWQMLVTNSVCLP